MRSVTSCALATLLGLAVLLPGRSLAAANGRPVPEYLKSATVYQIVLRNFTRQGSFRAATEMLDHVRGAGIDIVYLAPFVEMDRDMDVNGWSPRQIRSSYGSPKNSYRISNYDKIDPEYGSDADFAAFNAKAHALGMKTYMDLVYLHCGPNNVMRDLFSDAFQTNAQGRVRMTQWRFPYVNFASKSVRKYLIDSMLHWIGLGCDGFRCDVGDMVPLDFWVEAVTRCRAVKPDLVMINEGTNVEWLKQAFDACYAWPWSFTLRGMLTPGCDGGGRVKKGFAAAMKEVRAYEAKLPPDALMFSFMDNHDTATDDWEKRFDRVHPVDAGNAGFVLNFLRRGLPLVFNGNEIADSSLNSFFCPVENDRRAYKCVDWGCALKPSGQKRLALIRRLAALRHADRVFSEGTMEWRTDGEAVDVAVFTRKLGDRTVLVAANLKGENVTFTLSGLIAKGEPILVHDFKISPEGRCEAGPWGYVAIEAKAR